MNNLKGIGNKVKSKNEQKYFRFENETNLAKLCQKLMEYDWTDIVNLSDVNEAYNNFLNTYTHLYNMCCPLTKCKNKENKNKVWMTKGLVNACKKKSMLYKEFLKNRNKETEAKYKKYKNKLINILRKVEKDYYHRLLTDSKDNIRQTWTIINRIIR